MKKHTFLPVAAVLLSLLLLSACLQGIQEAVTTASSPEARNGYRDLKKVALTFDDGPDPVYTPMLLDALKEKNVKATFFLLGKQAELYPDLVKRIGEEGHTIGNHTYRHEHLGKMSLEQAAYQVNRTNEIIFELTGSYPLYLRPPFGIWKKKLDSEVNMIYVGWDLDTLDWSNQNHNKIIHKVVTKIKENDIILMHDAYKTTVTATVELINKLQKESYEFVTVEDLLL